MKVVRCNDETYASILQYAAQRGCNITRAVDELVAGQLSSEQDLSENPKELATKEDLSEILTTVLLRFDQYVDHDQSILHSRCREYEQQIRHLETQLQDSFPTCPKCGAPRSEHFAHAGDFVWDYGCPTSPHPSTARRPLPAHFRDQSPRVDGARFPL